MSENEKVDSGIGDTASNKKGSGARFNGGKPDYSLLDMRHVALLNESVLSESLKELGEYQFSGKLSTLENAYAFACKHAEMQFKARPVDVEKNADDHFMDTVTRVWEYGAQKYEAWNWAAGMPWSVCIACIGRHFKKSMLQDEYLDDESMQPHWAHVLCNFQMLLLYQTQFPEGNDLPFNVIED